VVPSVLADTLEADREPAAADRAGSVGSAQPEWESEAPAASVSITTAVPAAITTTVTPSIAVTAPTEARAAIAPATASKAGAKARAAVAILDFMDCRSSLRDGTDADLSSGCLGGREEHAGGEQAGRQCRNFEQTLSPCLVRGVRHRLRATRQIQTPFRSPGPPSPSAACGSARCGGRGLPSRQRRAEAYPALGSCLGIRTALGGLDG